MNDTQKLCELGLAVIEIESQAINNLTTRINEKFADACRYLLACEGRIVVIGMGKSGHIGGKIAATLASTGSPAFFVHPGEASHGDLGMITNKDVVLAISNSGETAEILTILPLIKRLGIPLITLTGNPNSTLARIASVNLDVSVTTEACPLGLAPTASTTATLVMGDALAVALLEARGFTAEDFARSHPAGSLGRRLLLQIDDVMRTGNAVPRTLNSASVKEALLEITAKGLGMTTIIDNAGNLLGIFTDGDLRRVLDQNINLQDTSIESVMTKQCKTVQPGMLAAEALKLMQDHAISALVVIDNHHLPIGVIHFHDLLRAGVA